MNGKIQGKGSSPPGENERGPVVFSRANGYVMRNVVDEFLLIPVALDECDTSKVSILNETGAFLWEKLEEKPSFEKLVEYITDEFDVCEAQAREDVKEFLCLLTENKLINIETEAEKK